MELDQSSYQRILDSLHDGLYFVDRDRKITYWNKAAERISGFAAEEVVGYSCADNILTHVDADGNCLCLGRCPLVATMEDGQPREAVVYLHHRDGHRIPVSVRSSVLTDERGEVIGAVELFTDLSGLGVHELRVRELEKLALLDSLTQLANRSYLERQLQGLIEETRRLGLSFGLLFIDIDNFKNFNDTFGHSVGDEIMRSVARTFISNSRPFDLYGRWGGEEFIALIKGCMPDSLVAIGNRVRQLVAQTYIVEQGEELRVTISLGATMYRSGESMKSLIHRADHLMYASKRKGRNLLTLG